MPDLSDLEHGGMLIRFAFWNAMLDLPVSAHEATANLKNLVRLVDKAIVEYEVARRAYAAVAGKKSADLGLVQDTLRGTNHIETLVSALDRAIQTANVLQRVAPPLKISSAELPSKRDRKRLRTFRNACEHAREWFGDGRLPAGQVVMIRAWPEGVEFAGDEIGFDALARWLRQMHALCERLSELIV